MIKILLFFACVANASSMFTVNSVDRDLYYYPDSNWADTNFYMKIINPGEDNQIELYFDKNGEYYNGVLHYKDSSEEDYFFIENGKKVKDSLSFDYTNYWQVRYSGESLIIYYFPDPKYKVVWTYIGDKEIMKFYEDNELCKTYEVNPDENHFYEKTICPNGKKKSNREYNCQCKKKDWPIDDFVM